MSFYASDKKVYDLLNDKEYIIPINQRKYVWGKSNWSELFDDLMLVLERKKPDHFIGSVVLKREKQLKGIRNRFSIIDGQQRISTLTIFLCSIGFIFIEKSKKDLFDGLTKPLFVNDNKNLPHPIVSSDANKSINKLVCKLFEYGSDYFAGKTLKMTNKEFVNSTNMAKNIVECFIYFYDELLEHFQSDFVSIEKLRTIIDEVRYIDIIAEDDEDAYTIFEILNARGQSLTDYELLCNYLLSRFDKDRKNEIKKELEKINNALGKNVEMFVKHYVTHKLGKKTNRSDNRPYKLIVQYSKSKNIEDVFNDIVLKSKYYSKIISFNDCSSLEYKIFSFFKPRRQQQFRPIVLGLMHQKDLKKISNEDYEKNLEFLYEFFICYHVIGEQKSNKIEDIVYGYSEKIENQFSANVLSEFKESIIKRIPNETAFKNSIRNVRYSHRWKAYSDSRKRENVFAIFEVIEREMGYDGDFTSLTVEHCLPDNVSENNSEIGNLMLLEKHLNKQCGSKELNNKMEFYSQSSLKCPIEFSRQFDKNKKFSIEKRSENIADTLYNYITRIKK